MVKTSCPGSGGSPLVKFWFYSVDGISLPFVFVSSLWKFYLPQPPLNRTMAIVCQHPTLRYLVCISCCRRHCCYKIPQWLTYSGSQKRFLFLFFPSFFALLQSRVASCSSLGCESSIIWAGSGKFSHFLQLYFFQQASHSLELNIYQFLLLM